MREQLGRRRQVAEGGDEQVTRVGLPQAAVVLFTRIHVIARWVAAWVLATSRRY